MNVTSCNVSGLAGAELKAAVGRTFGVPPPPPPPPGSQSAHGAPSAAGVRASAAMSATAAESILVIWFYLRAIWVRDENRLTRRARRRPGGRSCDRLRERRCVVLEDD